MEVKWSDEIPFDTEVIEREVPTGSGVYQIVQSVPYPRYEGHTRILKIGMSKSNLRQELLNHCIRHTVANRLARIRNCSESNVSIVFSTLPEQTATDFERELLRQFEDEHWDLPVLNSQRGYGRTKDSHYRN